jgi:hypothetical protein
MHVRLYTQAGGTEIQTQAKSNDSKTVAWYFILTLLKISPPLQLVQNNCCQDAGTGYMLLSFMMMSI